MPATPSSDEERSDEDRDISSDEDRDHVDAAFARIVSKIEPDMQWSPESAPAGGFPGLDQSEQPDERAERAERRALRRAERAAEVEAYEAEQARIEAERAADHEHYTPPDPPPLTRPRRRTMGALALFASGLFLLFGPTVLSLGPEAVVVLAFCCIVGGAVLLFSGLRRRRSDGDGYDDGAVV